MTSPDPATAAPDALPAGDAGRDAPRGHAVAPDRQASAEPAILVLSPTGEVVSWDAGASRLMGYTPDEIAGRHVSVLYPEEGRAAGEPERTLADAAARGRGDDEGWRVRKDGSRFRAATGVAALYRAPGELAGFAVTVRPLVELPATAEMARLSQAILGAIVSLSSDAIVCVDEEQRVTLFNQGAEQIFGYQAAEVIGQPMDLLIPERFVPRHRSEHLPAFARSTVASRRMGERREVYARRKSGEEFPAEVAISKAKVDGRWYFNAILRDVSARRRQEVLLQRQAEELARSNEELEQFAYVASHDLQEPLRMVASYTQLLAKRYEGRLDERADAWIGYAVDGARRMQSLINDLLALSRVGTRGQPLQAVDAGEVLARALASLRPTIAESGGAVTHGALPVVRADPAQLEQLLQNLVGNALKFRRPGVPPAVHVWAERRENAAEWLFGVRDNGIGLDPQFAEQVFVIFQRLHTRAEYPGTGIGLAICKKIVERHGGRIWVESAPGEGATFYFTLPDAAPPGADHPPS